MFSLHHFHIINLLPHVYHFCLISGAHRARGLLLSLETKVTKNSLFHTAREVDEIGISPGNPIIVSIAPTTTVPLFPLTEHKIRF